MYGVSPDLDLRFLHGARLIQIGLGEHQLQFEFHPTATVTVEGKWTHYDAVHLVLNDHTDLAHRRPIQLHRLLGQCLVNVQLSVPDSLTLNFDSGDALELLDSNRDVESIQIEPAGIVI